jgi:hypothetical protein
MALAINLAYLNLPIFRYRHQIREDAEIQLKALRSDDAVNADGVQHLDQYNEIRFLAEESQAKRPKGATLWWYSCLFSSRLDIYVTMFFSVFSCLLVFTGAAHDLDLWRWLPSKLTPFPSAIMFYLLLLSVLMPPLFVALGRQATRCAWGHTKHCSGQIADIFARKAGAAGLPEPLVRTVLESASGGPADQPQPLARRRRRASRRPALDEADPKAAD